MARSRLDALAQAILTLYCCLPDALSFPPETHFDEREVEPNEWQAEIHENAVLFVVKFQTVEPNSSVFFSRGFKILLGHFPIVAKFGCLEIKA